MKSNHKVVLTLLASLGLFALGAPVVNAKNVNSANHVSQGQTIKITHNQKLPELSVKLLPIHQQAVTKTKASSNQPRSTKTKVTSHDVSSVKVAQKPVKHDHVSIKSADKKLTNENKKVNSKNQSIKKIDSRKKQLVTKSHSNNKISKKAAHKNHQKATNQKLDHKKQSKKPKALSYNQISLPSKPLNDRSHQNIGNMKKFVKIRKPYHYTAIGGNTRDLGGYPTADHKYQTKVDRIIRSADLDGLSKTGLKALNKLRVTKIIDLRYQPSNTGISGHPDPNELHGKILKGTKISYQKDPVYSYSEAHHFDGYMKKNGIHGEFYYYGAPSINEAQAIKAYRQVFKDLLNNQHGAILYHCNLGRDRTGTTSALILSALGVSRNVIFHDYLLTDYYHYKYHRGNILPYSKQAGELAYFFKSIKHQYGSVKNYLNQAIGLSDSNIKQLQSMYLVSINQHQPTDRKSVV